MFIELPIVCNNDNTSQLRDLGVSISTDSYDKRNGIINVALISSCYPSSIDGETIIHIGADTYTIALTYDVVKDKIIEASLTI